MSGQCGICGADFISARRKYCSETCRLESKRRIANKWNKCNKEKHAEHQALWRKNNIELDKYRSKQKYAKDPDKVKQRVKNYVRRFRDEHGVSPKAYKNKNSINSKLKSYLRSRVRNAIINNQQKSIKIGSAIVALGCSIEDLKKHLESQFQPGMTWDNYGLQGWHIDHIIPLSSFNLADANQFNEACHYTNLQPLWAKDNIKKSNNI